MPYLTFGVAVLILVAAGEILHNIPGLEYLNAPSGEELPVQFTALAAAAVIYVCVTFLSFKISERRFERIDL